MKLFICTCIFFILSPQLFAQKETELLKAVKAKLDQVNDYEATGKMNVDVSFIKAPPSAVTIYFKKPDKFKILKEGGISILPKGSTGINLSGLLNNGDYTTVPAGNTVIKGVQTKVVKLLPLDENSDVVLTTLYIDEKELLIRKATTNTKESGSYEIEMDYGKYSTWGLPDKVSFLFNTKDYKLPKGITFEYEKGNKTKEETLKNKKGKIEIFYNSYSINKGINDAVFKSKL